MDSKICSVASNRFSVQSTTDSTHEDMEKMTCKEFCVCLAIGTSALAVLLCTMFESFFYCRPNIYIQEFQVPALKHPTHFNATSLNTTIFIDLNFQSDAKSWPNTSYADLEMTVFYGVDQSFPVAYYTIPAFAMGDIAGSVHKRVAVEAPGLPWEEAFVKVSGWQPVDLGVVLVVEYSDHDFDSGNGRAAVDVRVDGSGEMVPDYPKVLVPL